MGIARSSFGGWILSLGWFMLNCLLAEKLFGIEGPLIIGCGLISSAITGTALYTGISSIIKDYERRNIEKEFKRKMFDDVFKNK